MQTFLLRFLQNFIWAFWLVRKFFRFPSMIFPETPLDFWRIFQKGYSFHLFSRNYWICSFPRKFLAVFSLGFSEQNLKRFSRNFSSGSFKKYFKVFSHTYMQEILQEFSRKFLQQLFLDYLQKFVQVFLKDFLRNSYMNWNSLTVLLLLPESPKRKSSWFIYWKLIFHTQLINHDRTLAMEDIM